MFNVENFITLLQTMNYKNFADLLFNKKPVFYVLLYLVKAFWRKYENMRTVVFLYIVHISMMKKCQIVYLTKWALTSSVFWYALRASNDFELCYVMKLPLSWRRLLSYRNQSIDLQSKSMDWFLYDNGLRHERVKP